MSVYGVSRMQEKGATMLCYTVWCCSSKQYKTSKDALL